MYDLSSVVTPKLVPESPYVHSNHAIFYDFYDNKVQYHKARHLYNEILKLKVCPFTDVVFLCYLYSFYKHFLNKDVYFFYF